MYVEYKWRVEEPLEFVVSFVAWFFQFIIKHILFNKAIKNRLEGQLFSSVPSSWYDKLQGGHK